MVLLTHDQFGPYEITHIGVNAQGNIFHITHYLGEGHTNHNTFKYLNQDGSSYARYPDGTSVFNPAQNQ
ncbi:hypothetical protein SCHPADRAFT_910843 [Schizopora paradoxa]|uniref:Uncharacterized protein n=1 Tax=Schizopora paradoxa TaxID=27342 RepID=A0A0H2R1R0_9AGAM|nr:hypothetical protein SCHPADRAFT_910843 [Schizopora paradoxa]